LLIVYPATTIAVALYMLQGYFRGLPSELEDAGFDGWGLFTLGCELQRSQCPLSLPALASVALLRFMIAWNVVFVTPSCFWMNLDLFTSSRGGSVPQFIRVPCNI